MSFDISYPEFTRELQALRKNHYVLLTYFLTLVEQGTVVSNATAVLTETAFDGSYQVYKFTYLGGLEMFVRFQDNVFAFMSILRPRLRLQD